jgi:hypothetical protein
VFKRPLFSVARIKGLTLFAKILASDVRYTVARYRKSVFNHRWSLCHFQSPNV